MSTESELPIEISVAEVHRLRQSDQPFFFLDVRGPDEHQTASIDGTTLIPMNELVDRVGELEAHRNDHIVVHCHHGGRSMQVTQWLRNQGFSKAQNMTGGIEAWSGEVDPSVPRY